LGHFWTLSIEEQFYLVWPCCLLLFGVRRCRWIATIGAVSIAIYKWRMWHYYVGQRFIQTQVRADALLMGCLLALLLSEKTIYARVIRLSKWLAVPAAAGVIFACMRFPTLQPLWESACIAVLLAATMLHPSSIPSRILSWKPLARLGLVSYSVYVWQNPFMGFYGILPIFALMLCVFLPLFALGSYYLIERPCTRFGRRITSKRGDSAVASEQPQVAISN